MADTSPSYNLITTFQQRLEPQSIHLVCFDGSGSQSDSQTPPRHATHASLLSLSLVRFPSTFISE